ncbi:MAG: beta-lactamase family protein [Clostridia bacterium]|nr:beta-lactamase family protein [Clostridia bacterium]
MAEFRALAEYLDELAERSDPGNECVVTVGHDEVFRHRAGYADVESKKPIEGGELYYMWSVSKVATCSAFMTLVELGEVSLDDPVAKYVPEFGAMRRISDGGTVPVKTEMTLFHLITMTSGLSYDSDFPSLEKMKKDPGDPCRTVDVARAAGSKILSFEPGQSWLYGLSHDIIAAVCETVSGMRFSEFVKARIFDPLGMKDSTFHPISEKEKSRMATQYRFDPDRKIRIRTNNTNGFIFGDEYESGGAGLVSTASDCSLLAEALACGGECRGGGRILKKETVDDMRRNRLTPELITSKGFREFHYLKGYGYGLGVRTMINPHGIRDGYAVPGEFGWDGAAGAVLIADPVNKVSLFYVRHMLEGEQALEDLRKRMYEGLFGAGLIEKKEY